MAPGVFPRAAIAEGRKPPMATRKLREARPPQRSPLALPPGRQHTANSVCGSSYRTDYVMRRCLIIAGLQPVCSKALLDVLIHKLYKLYNR